MSLQQQIKDDLKEAMKAKDKTRTSVLRNITSEISNELVANDKTPQDEADDELVQRVIERLAKQRRESIEEYRNAGQNERVDEESAELQVLESYLPEKMNEEDIRAKVQAKIDDVGATDPSQMGQVMGPLMQELQGQANGDDVKRIVEEELQSN